MEQFDNLKRLVNEVEPDIDKADGGNQAAGVRVRKAMQDLKDAAQAVREHVLEERGMERDILKLYPNGVYVGNRTASA